MGSGIMVRQHELAGRRLVPSLGSTADTDEGYLKEQRYYNNTSHSQIHSSGTLGIDGL